MGVYRLPKDHRPRPTYPARGIATTPSGFGGPYNWLCQKPLPYIDSYKTSASVGNYHIHPISERYDRLTRPLPCRLAARDPLESWDRLLTTTGLAHDAKGPTKDPATFPGNYVGVGSINLVRKFDEHIKHRPHNKWPDASASATATVYRRHDVIPSWGKLADQTPLVECTVRCDGLAVQPRVPPEDGGFVRLLDPLVSTTSTDYHLHTECRQSDRVGKKDIITYWDAEGYPRARGWGFGPRESQPLKGPTHRTSPDPVYDKEQFAHRALHRRLPTRVNAVPHKGLQSEQQARFQLPLDDFVSHRWVTAGVEYPLALYANTLAELLTVPGMYCPESAHYGSRIPVKTMVDTGPVTPPALVKCLAGYGST